MDDKIRRLFPQFDDAGLSLVERAYGIAAEALEGLSRWDGRPFIGHPLNVALIAADEIGLPAECVAAVFLHEAERLAEWLDIEKARETPAGYPRRYAQIKKKPL